MCGRVLDREIGPGRVAEEPERRQPQMIGERADIVRQAVTAIGAQIGGDGRLAGAPRVQQDQLQVRG